MSDDVYTQPERRAMLASDAEDVRNPIVARFLARRFPLASNDDIAEILEECFDEYEEYANTPEHILEIANDALSSRLAIWKEARAAFLRAMTRDVELT